MAAAGSTASGFLDVDAEELAACVSCGLCLAHCPTYRASGEEGLSPRGRIAAMRAVDAGAPADASFARLMRTCVQCRACETACPSSVPFGRLMEGARHALVGSVPGWQRVAYGALGSRRLLSVLTSAGAVAQRARLVPPSLARRLSLPRLPLHQAPLGATGSDVWLFTGCVMDAWQRDVHRAAVAVIGACGAGVAIPGGGASCCGALHVHAGLRPSASRLARRVVASFPGEAPVLVDSAGCGATLKEYGHLLATDEARCFSARVRDVHEWLAERVDRLPPPAPGWRKPRVAIQDPCHLRHAQRCHEAVRVVLERYADLLEVPDDGRCCGAGGAYSALQPELARSIRTQKLAVLSSLSADVVASANPGCSMWLAGAGVRVAHPVEIVARAAGLAGAHG